MVAIRVKPTYPIRQVVYLTFPIAGLPLVLGLGAPLPVAVAVAFAVGVAVDILVVLWDTTMQREIPAEALSRVSSYDALGTLLLGPVGLLLAGPSVDLIGSESALLISAAVIVIASVAALCSPGARNLRWTVPEASVEPDTAQLDNTAEPARAEACYHSQLRLDVAEEEHLRPAGLRRELGLEVGEDVELRVVGVGDVHVVVVVPAPEEGLAARDVLDVIGGDSPLREHRQVLLAEVVADRSDHAHVREEARCKREVAPRSRRASARAPRTGCARCRRRWIRRRSGPRLRHPDRLTPRESDTD